VWVAFLPQRVVPSCLDWPHSVWLFLAIRALAKGMEMLKLSASILAVSAFIAFAAFTDVARACASDDGSGVLPCVWNAAVQGNGLGASFSIDADGNVNYL
jgi:hypothetical protein